MATLADLFRKRRRTCILAGSFLLVSLVLCIGSYFGWFGWFLWGKPKKAPAPVVAEGDEATAFARRLLQTEARYARDDVKKLREILKKLNIGKDSRYSKYAQETRTAEPLASLSVAEPTAEQQQAAAVDTEPMDLIQLYGVALQLDRRAHNVYRIFRACELARVQRMPLKEAYEATDVVAPDRPAPDLAVLRGPIRSTASPQMQAFRQELSTLKTEIKSMVGAAARMLDLAAILEPGLLGTGSDWDFGQGYGEMYRTTMLIERPPTLFEGQTGVPPSVFEHEWGRGDGPITKKELELPVELGIDLSRAMPLPGRKLLREGRTGDWMFINSWYLIGPFPNPERRNLSKKFPPEASLDPERGFMGIDLDAVYVGAGGKPVRWDYLATDRRVCFVPHRPEEWVIWYAYTEIWSETEQEKFCIFGSDDFGQCWINGELVYTSGITPHPWVPDRAYSKVKFRQGFNTVLFKLENTWGRTGYSLCVFTGKPAGEEAKTEG